MGSPPLLLSAEVYDILSAALPATVGGWPLHFGGDFLPPPSRGGDGPMVTYAELFQFCLVIVGIVGLVVQITKKK